MVNSVPASRSTAAITVVSAALLLLMLGAADGYTPYFTNVRLVTLPNCP